MTVIAIANQKGGCGKTTTAINLAASLGRRGFRVLLLDMDAQGHASLGLGKRCHDIPGLYEVFAGEISLSEAIIPSGVEGVDLVPATISLAATEHVLADIPDKEYQLAHQLGRLIQPYDFVILDCPPALGMLSINALMTAQQIIIPVELSLFAMDGIDRLLDTIELLGTRYDLDPAIEILPTMVDPRTRLSKDILHSLQEKFRDHISPLVIHYTVRLKEAAFQGKPIIDHAPQSIAAVDYERLAARIIERYAANKAARQPLDIAQITSLPASAFREKRRTLPTFSMPKINSAQTVTLVFENISDLDLKIAGDFNGWIPDKGVETRLTRDGVQKVLTVNPGDYQYRVIINGKWQEDPCNPHRIANGMGDNNSLLHVPGEREACTA